VKNSPADARAKAAEGNPTHSATTGEMDIYKVRLAARHNAHDDGGLQSGLATHGVKAMAAW
jgi:hypothetical protein